MTSLKDMKERVIEAPVGITHGPVITSDAQGFEERKRLIHFKSLRGRR